MFDLHSSLPEIAWPAAPSPRSAALLSMLFQLEQTQWLSPSALLEKQRLQLGKLVEHACNYVPFYRRRFDEMGQVPADIATAGVWERLPILTRPDLQDAGQAVASSRSPATHGPPVTLTTSGSCGAPVAILGNGLTQLMWEALTLRDHLWHKRDLSESCAGIRYVRSGGASYPTGECLPSWGAATQGVVATGTAYLLNIQSTLNEQAEWVQRVNPVYLITYPSVIEALANHFRKQSLSLSNLREVRTFGEILSPTCRSACFSAWGVSVKDMYSAQETGYIALQCPISDNYHVQAESVFVEVVDPEGQPTPPGEVGRILVTPLHNFSMPLLRYDIGDYAEVGDACPCGRGLPVLKRIVGRKRNLLRLPNGERRWPVFGEGAGMADLPPLRQFQVIQHSLSEIEVKLVCPKVFTDDELRHFTTYVQATLGHPFSITFNRVPEIPRHPTGKFEDFVSHLET